MEESIKFDVLRKLQGQIRINFCRGDPAVAIAVAPIRTQSTALIQCSD